MICKELNILHIAICRNACVSIRDAFRRKFKDYEFIFKHHSVSDVGEMVSEDELKKYRSFCVVRNPFDRMVSIWMWHYYNWEGIAFKDFLKMIVDRKRSKEEKRRSKQTGLSSSWVYRPQLEWITDTSGEIRVNRILRFETLDDDFSQLCGDWGLPVFKLPKLNTSEKRSKIKRKPWRSYYDEEDMDVVRKMYKGGFEVFGYDLK